jgi:hypothetical protein
MKYHEIKKKVFANALVPDGYFGNKAKIELAFDEISGKTYGIIKEGCFTTHVPQALSEDEALWLIKNHPSCYRHFSDVKEI